MSDLFTDTGARFSPCAAYRYHLWRIWEPALPHALFVMLNPSTADATLNDPTVERCQRRADALGYGGLHVVNLFALRSTDPGALAYHADPVGPENDAAIKTWAETVHRDGGRVICAWGAYGNHRNRAAEVCDLLRREGVPLFCLGTTAAGEPRHPLYVAYARELEPYTGRGVR